MYANWLEMAGFPSDGERIYSAVIIAVAWERSGAQGSLVSKLNPSARRNTSSFFFYLFFFFQQENTSG